LLLLFALIVNAVVVGTARNETILKIQTWIKRISVNEVFTTKSGDMLRGIFKNVKISKPSPKIQVQFTAFDRFNYHWVYQELRRENGLFWPKNEGDIFFRFLLAPQVWIREVLRQRFYIRFVTNMLDCPSSWSNPTVFPLSKKLKFGDFIGVNESTDGHISGSDKGSLDTGERFAIRAIGFNHFFHLNISAFNKFLRLGYSLVHFEPLEDSDSSVNESSPNGGSRYVGVFLIVSLLLFLVRAILVKYGLWNLYD